MAKKFNMQNVLVWIVNDKKGGFKFRYGDDFKTIENYLRLQVENSLQLGWDKKDIIFITNFPFEYMGVKSNEIDSQVCRWSAFANRMVVVNEMIKKGIINDNFWVHDADAYQLEPFVFPVECKDVGFTKHAPGRSKPQGASAFYRKEAYDIVDVLSEMILLFKPTKEESFFPIFYNKAGGEKKANIYRQKILTIPQNTNKYKICEKGIKYFGKFWDRFSWLDWTYNLCQQRMFHSKYPHAQKPIKVVHFKTEHPSTMDVFYYGKNKYNVRIVTDRLDELFIKHNLVSLENRRK